MNHWVGILTGVSVLENPSMQIVDFRILINENRVK